MAFGLVPEVLDSVDVVFLVGEQRGVVDAQVPEMGDIEYVVRSERVGVDDRIRSDTLFDDGQQRDRLCVGDDGCVDLAFALQQAENSNFSGSAAAPATKYSIRRPCCRGVRRLFRSYTIR